MDLIMKQSRIGDELPRSLIEAEKAVYAMLTSWSNIFGDSATLAELRRCSAIKRALDDMKARFDSKGSLEDEVFKL